MVIVYERVSVFYFIVFRRKHLFVSFVKHIHRKMSMKNDIQQLLAEQFEERVTQ